VHTGTYPRTNSLVIFLILQNNKDIQFPICTAVRYDHVLYVDRLITPSSEKSQLKERLRCRHLIDENSSEEHPLGCRLLLHGLGVEELVAVAGVPPLLRPDEPRQEPPNLLLLAALLLLLPRRLPLPFRRLRFFLPARRLLTGRHQRLREGGDVDEG
jgi:hypothetical protein